MEWRNSGVQSFSSVMWTTTCGSVWLLSPDHFTAQQQRQSSASQIRPEWTLLPHKSIKDLWKTNWTQHVLRCQHFTIKAQISFIFLFYSLSHLINGWWRWSFQCSALSRHNEPVDAETSRSVWIRWVRTSRFGGSAPVFAPRSCFLEQLMRTIWRRMSPARGEKPISLLFLLHYILSLAVASRPVHPLSRATGAQNQNAIFHSHKAWFIWRCCRPDHLSTDFLRSPEPSTRHLFSNNSGAAEGRRGDLDARLLLQTRAEYLKWKQEERCLLFLLSPDR